MQRDRKIRSRVRIFRRGPVDLGIAQRIEAAPVGLAPCRLERVPVRLPLPPADYQGSIYTG